MTWSSTYSAYVTVSVYVRRQGTTPSIELSSSRASTRFGWSWWFTSQHSEFWCTININNTPPRLTGRHRDGSNQSNAWRYLSAHSHLHSSPPLLTWRQIEASEMRKALSYTLSSLVSMFIERPFHGPSFQSSSRCKLRDICRPMLRAPSFRM